MPDEADEALEIVDRIQPLLAGCGPEVQGAILCQLVAMWVAGWHVNGPEFVEDMLTLHVKTVRDLLPVNIEEMKSG